MRLLLDTHTFLWFLNGEKQLPPKIKDQIKDTGNVCFLSIASIWEIAIKLSLKKLHLGILFSKLPNLLQELNIDILPLTFEHINILVNLEWHHRDPFDRIIISQAQFEGLIVLSKDENFNLYPIQLAWE